MFSCGGKELWERGYVVPNKKRSGIVTLSLCCPVISFCRILFLFVKVLPQESSRFPHARCTVLLGSTVATTASGFHPGLSLLTTFAWSCWILPRGVHRWYGKSSSHSGNYSAELFTSGEADFCPRFFCLQEL